MLTFTDDIQRQTAVCKQHHPLIADGPHLNVQALRVHEGWQVPVALAALREARDLAHQLRADLAGADDADGHCHVREREARVGRSQCAREVLARHHGRDVALGGALRDGDDVDLRAAQRVEEAATDACPPLHVLADDREDADAAAGGGADLQLLRELQGEGLPDRGQGGLLVALVDGHGDGVLRGALGRQDHVDAGVAQRFHHSPAHARCPQEGRAAQRDERDLLDGGDGLHGEVVVVVVVGLVRPAQPVVSAPVDAGARVRGIEDVPDQHGDPLLDAGNHRGGVQDLPSEVCQLHSLVEGHGLDGEGSRHTARVCCVDTIHVLPHCHAGGTENLGKDRGRVVRAASLQGRRTARGRAADEARDNQEGCRRVRPRHSDGLAPPAAQAVRALIPEGHNGVQCHPLLTQPRPCARIGHNQHLPSVHPSRLRAC
mmetsp:Transcript_40646/g.116049  ORF Transcript_40646/g.116049 Transcript_40646/m.116049 type:complete len:431 (+) Transcript_40646:1276-2568(+)